MEAMFCSSQLGLIALSFFCLILQFTLVKILRRFSVLKFILDGILSNGDPSLTSFSSSKMHSAIISGVTNYVSNGEFLTRLSWIVSIDNSTLSNV